MKKIVLLLFMSLVPLVSFSAIGIGIRIPIVVGPQSPPVYVNVRSYPAGPWEDVSLSGIIIGATADRVMVKTPEGIQHSVYFTNQTVVQGALAYGALINVDARLVNGKLYASGISVLNSGAYPEAPVNTPPPQGSIVAPQMTGQILQGTLLETAPNSIVLRLPDGSQRRILFNGQTQIYGALDLGSMASVNAYQANGAWYAQSINVSYNSYYANPPTYVYPYPTYVYPYPDCVYPSVYVWGGWGWHGGWHHRHWR